MSTATIRRVPRLGDLPSTVPADGAVRIEIEEGKPVLRASSAVQERIEHLLQKQHGSALTSEEERELDGYEEMDDYLSLVNRVVRDLLDAPGGQAPDNP